MWFLLQSRLFLFAVPRKAEGPIPLNFPAICVALFWSEMPSLYLLVEWRLRKVKQHQHRILWFIKRVCAPESEWSDCFSWSGELRESPASWVNALGYRTTGLLVFQLFLPIWRSFKYTFCSVWPFHIFGFFFISHELFSWSSDTWLSINYLQNSH